MLPTSRPPLMRAYSKIRVFSTTPPLIGASRASLTPRVGDFGDQQVGLIKDQGNLFYPEGRLAWNYCKILYHVTRTGLGVRLPCSLHLIFVPTMQTGLTMRLFSFTSLENIPELYKYYIFPVGYVCCEC